MVERKWELVEFMTAAPDLRLYDPTHTFGTSDVVVNITGLGRSLVNRRVAQDVELNPTSCMVAVTSAVAAGYPPPPVDLVRKFTALNEKEWDSD